MPRSDLRQSHRLKAEISASVALSQASTPEVVVQTVAGQIVDVGFAGLRLRLSSQLASTLAQGDWRMTLTATQGRGEPIIINGSVKWTRPQAGGLLVGVHYIGATTSAPQQLMEAGLKAQTPQRPWLWAAAGAVAMAVVAGVLFMTTHDEGKREQSMTSAVAALAGGKASPTLRSAPLVTEGQPGDKRAIKPAPIPFKSDVQQTTEMGEAPVVEVSSLRYADGVYEGTLKRLRDPGKKVEAEITLTGTPGEKLAICHPIARVTAEDMAFSCQALSAPSDAVHALVRVAGSPILDN